MRPTPGATLRYTLDGSDPDESSPEVGPRGVVRLPGSRILKARAWASGRLPSQVAEAAFAVRAMSAGPNHVLYAGPDGVLWAWGDSDAGQLGDGSVEPSTGAVRARIDGVVEAAAGRRHSVARRGDHSVWAWGDGSFGQLGGTIGGGSAEPRLVEGLGEVVALAAGDNHTIALMADGAVLGWGRNDLGQLGGGTAEGSATPTAVEGLSDVVQVAAGADHSLALRSDGTVWSWGGNHLGQLGDGSTTNRTRPVQVSGLPTVARIGAGDLHSLAIGEDGSVWGWGAGSSGQLGALGGAVNVAPVLVRTCHGEDRSPIDRLGDASPGSGLPARAVYRVDGGLDHSAGYLEAVGIGPLGLWTWGRRGYADCEDIQSAPGAESMGAIAALSVAGTRNLALAASGALWYWEQTGSGATAPVALSDEDGALRAFPPAFDVAPGTYRSELAVTVTALTPGSTIHYTTDGSWPDETSPALPSGSVVPVTRSTRLQAIAIVAGRPPSDVRTAEYVLKVMDPVLTPPPSGFDGPVDVTLSVGTAEAVLRYGINSAPAEDDPVFPSGTRVTLVPPASLGVRAYRDGWETSEAGGTYRLAVSTPILDPPGGTFHAPVTVTVTTPSPGVTLRYRLDGAEPSFSDPVLASGGTIRVDHSLVLAVSGWRDDLGVSDVARGTYRFTLPPPTLHGRRSHGDNGAVYVTGATSVDGALVRCTTDGSEPTPLSRPCARPLPLDSTSTVRARAFAFGWEPSATTEKTFTIAAGVVATPAISLASGTYPAARNVSIFCPTPGAQIHYTTDGADPGPGDPMIASGDTLLVDRSLTLKARAWRGDETSLVGREDYAIVGAISVAGASVLVLSTDGTVRGWGANQARQLGIGDVPGPVLAPTAAPITEVVQVVTSTGYPGPFTIALRRDGTVWTWGDNQAGLLGTGQGDGSYRATPAPVGLTDIVAVAAGAFAVALGADGSLWTWGVADPDGHPERYLPQRRTDIDCARVFAYDWRMLCVDRAGEAWVGTQDGPFSPASGSRSVIEVFDIYLNDLVSLYTDGGRHGGLSLGTSVLASRAARDVLLGTGARPWRTDSLVDGRLWVEPDAAPAVAVGTSSIVRADGTLWRWGANGSGELGEGTTTTTSRETVGLVPGLSLFSDTWLLQDSDGDALSNLEELDCGTDPYLADTNQDGVSDGASAGVGIDPVSVDLDGDGLTNEEEAAVGTDPLVADTDGDGVVDCADSYPLDPSRTTGGPPDPTDTTPPGITLAEPANAVLASSLP